LTENISLLGKFPLDPEVVRQGDAGRATGVLGAESPFTRAFEALVDQVVKESKEADKRSAQVKQS
jgi:hypothetical protein